MLYPRNLAFLVLACVISVFSWDISRLSLSLKNLLILSLDFLRLFLWACEAEYEVICVSDVFHFPVFRVVDPLCRYCFHRSAQHLGRSRSRLFFLLSL